MENLIRAAREQASRLIRAAYEEAARRGQLPAGREVRGAVEMPRDGRMGDFASSFAIASAGVLGVPPRQAAQTIAGCLELDGTLFSRVECAGPGYLNFFCGPRWYAGVLDAVEQALPAPVPASRPLPAPPAPLAEVRRQAWADALANLLRRIGRDAPPSPAEAGPVLLLQEGSPAPGGSWAQAGEDALRFFLTLRPIGRPVELDLDLAARQDGGNPLYYIQYTCARIGVLTASGGDGTPQAGGGKALVKTLARYPEELRAAGEGADPSRVGRYLLSLSEEARRLYQAPGQGLGGAGRRALGCAGLVLADGLGLLGIGAGPGKNFSEGVAICGKPW